MDRDDQFAWGPLALGSYGAMLSLTVVVALYFSHYLGWYVALLLFLGIGLKPLLVRTGLAARLGVLFDSAEERRWRGVTRKRRRDHIKRTIAIYRSLLDAELLERLPAPDAAGRTIRATATRPTT